jgi:hypothetical protein
LSAESPRLCPPFGRTALLCCLSAPERRRCSDRPLKTSPLQGGRDFCTGCAADQCNREQFFAPRARLAWASRSRLEPFIKLARTTRRHRDGILAAIRLGLTNGRLEGLNSRIRLIGHRSFGFHSAAPLIALVYLCCTLIAAETDAARKS